MIKCLIYRTNYNISYLIPVSINIIVIELQKKNSAQQTLFMNGQYLLSRAKNLSVYFFIIPTVLFNYSIMKKVL